MTQSFRSFGQLKSAYETLAERQRSASKDDKAIVADIRDFVAAAAKAGQFIEDLSERRSAQDMLDYWFTHLLSRDDDEIDVVSPRLADYRGSADASEEGEAASAARTTALDRSRQVVRLGAVARQWRDGGMAKGYLLKGAALEDARRYSDDDPDIAALVRASEENERRSRSFWLFGLAAVSAVLAVLSAVAVYQAYRATEARELAEDRQSYAEQQQKIAEQQRQLAEEAKLAAEQAKLIAEEERAEAQAQQRRAEAETAEKEKARLEAEELAKKAQQDTEALNRQLAELRKQQEVLDLALQVIRDQIRSGKLARTELPEALAGLIEPEQGIDIPSFFTNPPVALNGYDPDFIGVPIELPGLSADNRSAAFAGGQPVDYVNYSLVLNQRRRMAFFAAVNLDRESLRILPRTDLFQQLIRTPDPRVPPGALIDVGWFSNNDIDMGHLATRSEIAWGPAFQQDDAVAAAIRDRVVDVTTNITPQFDVFNRELWAQLERWALTEHNPLARQVTMFTGPVFSSDDPVLNGVQIPRAFWKVLVSPAPSTQQAQVAPTYVVDAFVLSQFKAGTNEKISAGGKFDPEAYRIPVVRLERMTGLRFAEIIRKTDEIANPLTPDSAGDILAAKAGLLDGPDASERKAVAQELVTALRDGGLPWAEQQKVLSALVGMAQEASMLGLSATGRLNLLFVLSQVPTATWDMPEALDLKAGARGAAASLEARAAANLVEIGRQTREHLARLEKNVGYGSKSTQIVDLNFVGLTRDEAGVIAERMQQLGWQVGGGGRGKEPSENEVRYNPEMEPDRLAAELLAADLRAAGIATAKSMPNAATRPGSLEIWLSK